MVSRSIFTIITVLAALLVAGLAAGGCSHSSPAAMNSQAPIQPGAPTNVQVAAQRAMVEQRMTQSREMATAAWRQSHPGQKLPPGF